MVVIEPGTPEWWKRAALSFERLFVASGRPLQLPGYTTAQLPDATAWRGCLVYDETTDQVKRSNGVTWNAL